MPLKNTAERFGHMARSIHWLSALIVLSLLSMGFIMAEMPFSPFKLELYGFHKSFGMLVLGLTLMRVIWKVTNISVNHLPSHTALERLLAKTIHIVLYISLIAMPLSGWVMSNAGEFPNAFFGLFEFPALVDKNEAIYKGAKQAHEFFAYTFIGSIGLHIVGALKHHFIDKDETLRRMGGNILLAFIGCVLLAIPTYFAAEEILEEKRPHKTAIEQSTAQEIKEEADTRAPKTNAPQWVIAPDQSKISFAFSQYGQDITGHFESWEGEISFDPARLDLSSVNVTINVATLKTGSEDRDEQARNEEWFSANEYPLARFKSESFEKIKDQKYKVKGALTLRGISLPIEFPFDLTINNNEAKMSAELILKRLDFGVGQGQWATTDAIGNEVKITLNIDASKVEK